MRTDPWAQSAVFFGGAVALVLLAWAVVLLAQPSKWVAHLGCLGGGAAATVWMVGLTVATSNPGFMGEGGAFAGVLIGLLLGWLAVDALITSLVVWRVTTTANVVVLVHFVMGLGWLGLRQLFGG